MPRVNTASLHEGLWARCKDLRRVAEILPMSQMSLAAGCKGSFVAGHLCSFNTSSMHLRSAQG